MSMFRRMMMKQGSSGGIIPSDKAIAGDICMYDTTNDKLVIANDWDVSKYPINTYIPVGVVVVPASHGHYTDGKCAIMSLNHMSCNTPQTGGNAQEMYWGVYGTDIEALTNLTQVPYVGSNGSIGDTVIGASGRAYLPSDSSGFTSVVNPYDPKTKYYDNDASYEYIPSPYNNDGTFNTNYSLTDSSLISNCLSDFNGYSNTKKILEVRGNKDYSSWLPIYNIELDYPAVSCCDMYSTVGIPQGSWYLPSMGELGYVCVRKQALDNSLNKLIDNGVSSANTLISYGYWSSSEFSDSLARYIFLTNGYITYASKDYGLYVRPFALV